MLQTLPDEILIEIINKDLIILNKLICVSRVLRERLANKVMYRILGLSKRRKSRNIKKMCDFGLTEMIRLLVDISNRNLNIRNPEYFARALKNGRLGSCRYLTRFLPKIDNNTKYLIIDAVQCLNIKRLEVARELGLFLTEQDIILKIYLRKFFKISSYYKSVKTNGRWEFYLACYFNKQVVIQYFLQDYNFQYDLISKQMAMLGHRPFLLSEIDRLCPISLSELEYLLEFLFYSSLEVCRTLLQIMWRVDTEHLYENSLASNIIARDRIDLFRIYANVYKIDAKHHETCLNLAIRCNSTKIVNYYAIGNFASAATTFKDDIIFYRNNIPYIIDLIKCNVNFSKENLNCVFNQGMKNYTLFAELIRSNMYCEKFFNWCNADDSRRKRMQQNIKKVFTLWPFDEI